jgi:membrane protein insertase Oxa1/YidC/SpoIIIJ
MFGVIYFKIAAGAVLYMVVSSMMRLGTQIILFRVVPPINLGNNGAIDAKSKELPKKDPGELEAGEAQPPPKPHPRSKDKRDRRAR